MAHYVYYSYEDWGRGYIGSRSTKKTAVEDRSYMGSFRDKTFKPNNKIILMEFETGAEAREAEISLHNFFEVAKNSHFANKAKQTSSSFSTEGTVGPWANKKRSEQDRKKMCKSGKKSSKGMLGKTRSEETIQKWKESMKAEDRSLMREKLRQKALEQWADPKKRETILSSRQKRAK